MKRKKGGRKPEQNSRTYLLGCQTWAKVKIILEASGSFLAESVLFKVEYFKVAKKRKRRDIRC
jgi:hypothetical protein